MRWALGAIACACAIAAPAPAAHGYEFTVRARTIGQGYELTSIRFLSPDLQLTRRRFTTTLSLDIWDLSGRLKKLELHDPVPSGPRYYLSSYLRLDHDFGDWTSGQIELNQRLVDAVDLIPELDITGLELELLWGYVAAEDLFGGHVDLRLGRLLEVDALDWMNLDGMLIRASTPIGVAGEVFGGWRVRDSSPMGSGTHELDGTAGALCAEYVEGATPGSGSWRPIDRQVMTGDNPFESDFDLCPQRDERMPTWGLAFETDELDRLSARVSYRRTVSRTPGIIGPPDRFEFEDVGLYPDENDQAPDWGVNEEVVSATARYRFDFADGGAQLTPYVAARYSVLHALVDEGHAGARLRWGMHSIEPELYYSFPTFDGDSIFNVFSAEPYADARVTYDLAPEKSPWRAYVRGWGRRFITEDAERTRPDADVEPSAYAGGVQGGARYLASRSLWGRADLFHEGGYGGRRTGGYVTGRWRPHRLWRLAGRLSVIDFREDLRPELEGVTFGAQLGGTYLINVDGLAVHLLVEQTNNRITPSQLRVIGVIDLAFQPEVP